MKTRVLLTINNLDTAGSKYVLAAIATGINQQLFTPVIIVNQKTGSVLEKQLEKQIEVKQLMLRSPGFPQMISGWQRKIRAVKELGDIAHSFDYSSDWYEALLMKRAGIPYISMKTNLSFDSYRWKFKLKLASHIVCISEAQTKLLNRYKNKLSLFPVGIDIPKFRDAVPCSRASLGFSDDDIILISVAHMVPVKGYEELIDAVAEVKSEFPKLKILVVGRGSAEYEQFLKAKMNDKGVADRFVLIGESDQVPSLLKMADGKILATQNLGRREAFGTALVEAMAAGLPVIATRSGGPEEIILDKINGWLVDGIGYQPLANGIRTFMNARAEWKSFGRNGLERVNEKYNRIEMIANHENLYRNLAGI